MFRLKIEMDDLTVVAESPTGLNEWSVSLRNTDVQKRYLLTLTHEQLCALVTLGLFSVGEENIDGYNVNHLYSVIEPALVGCPIECRPIP